MNKEFCYYRVHRNGDNSIPLLASDTGNPRYLYQEDRIESPQIMLFRLGKPVPKKPKMADYLSAPSSIVSKKIADVLMPLKIEGIQLLPARIRGKNDQLFIDYWAIHIYHNLKCIDAERSDCTIESSGLEDVKKIFLDKKILGAMPLEKRLVFRLGEDSAYQLFHSSVVEAIIAVNPDGVKFTNIEDWHEGSFFDN